jgi:hypothetical protein
MKDYQRAYRVGRHGELAATKAEVSEMLVSQDGLCAICYEEPATDLDHDHATGELRGMLCKRCNLALGLFDDDPERLRFAAEYVTTPRIQEVV